MKKLLGILLLTGATFLTGCGNSFEDDFVITNNNGVIVAPVCVDDAYAVNSNTTLTVNAANGVLANDTLNGAAITNFATASANGGTVTVNADGSFVYVPQTNFSGSDSFTYTVGNSAGTRTCTVTITVTAVDGFFVDATNGDDGTGSFTNGQPFATIQAALTAAPAGSDIVIRPGSYTGAINNLENGDRLLGSGSVLAQGTAVRPVLTGPIELADGNTVDFIRIANAAGDAIDGDDQSGGTITNCEIDTTTGGGAAVSGFRIDGTWNVSTNTISNTSGSAIVFTTEGTDTATVRINDNQITGSMFNAIGFITSDSSDLVAQVTGNIMTGNQTGFTFEVIAGGASTACYDIENNTNDDTYLVSQTSTATGTLEVEEFSNLIAVNNNSGTTATSGGSTPPTSVADGTCGF